MLDDRRSTRMPQSPGAQRYLQRLPQLLPLQKYLQSTHRHHGGYPQTTPTTLAETETPPRAKTPAIKDTSNAPKDTPGQPKDTGTDQDTSKDTPKCTSKETFKCTPPVSLSLSTFEISHAIPPCRPRYPTPSHHRHFDHPPLRSLDHRSIIARRLLLLRLLLPDPSSLKYSAAPTM